MELIKILFVATCLITISSVVSSAPTPRSKTSSDLEILVRTLLAPRVNLAIEKMLKLYRFINSTSNHLKDPFDNLGLDDGTVCSPSQHLKEKLSELLNRLSVFKSPLYMAFSYEQTQGPQHTSLASVLRNISHYVNVTVAVVTLKMQKNTFPLPNGQPPLREADLNGFTRQYLQALPDNDLTLTITDDLVKIYRNYIILYTLHDVIKLDAIPCIKGV